MPFRGLTMLKSPKLTIKGGLCYVFAMVSNIYAMYFEGISTMHERVENQWRYYFMALKSCF